MRHHLSLFGQAGGVCGHPENPLKSSFAPPTMTIFDGGGSSMAFRPIFVAENKKQPAYRDHLPTLVRKSKSLVFQTLFFVHGLTCVVDDPAPEGDSGR